MKKIKTYTIYLNGSEGLTDHRIEQVTEALNHVELEVGDELAIRLEERFTQEEYDNLHEWDGDF